MEEETRQVVFETNGKTFKELYDNIIEENLRNPPPEGENTIKHHIKPRSIFPDLRYSRENMVRLTEKVHLLVHYLLWQYYKHETDDGESEMKMCVAFWKMVHGIEWRGDAELEWIADKFEELMVDFRKNNLSKRPEVRAKRFKKVLQYSLDGTFVAEYLSIKEAAVKTNSCKCVISLCCAGKRKTHNGFVWKYAESK